MLRKITSRCRSQRKSSPNQLGMDCYAAEILPGTLGVPDADKFLHRSLLVSCDILRHYAESRTIPHRVLSKPGSVSCVAANQVRDSAPCGIVRSVFRDSSGSQATRHLVGRIVAYFLWVSSWPALSLSKRDRHRGRSALSRPTRTRARVQ